MNRIGRFIRMMALATVAIINVLPVLVVFLGGTCFIAAGTIAAAIYLAARPYLFLPELGGSAVVMLVGGVVLAGYLALSYGVPNRLRRGVLRSVEQMRPGLERVARILLAPTIAAERRLGHDLHD